MRIDGTLAVLPNLKAGLRDDGRVVLTQKFIDGIGSYVEHWNGPVVVLIEPDDKDSDNLDNVAVHPDELDFGVDVASYDASDLRDKLAACAVAQGGLSYRQNHIAHLCDSVGVPFVYGTEYTLKTRLQIIRAEETSPIVRAKRILWEWNQERLNRAAIRAANGLQCNGTPTHDAYAPLNDNALLFFDTRMSENMLADPEAIERRAVRLHRGEHLRIAFSGRLNRMKGADHLIALARILKARSVPFELVVCGGGALEKEMHDEIKANGLADVVTMRGVLDFNTELVPFMQRDVDLFVCCHRQGDPSCTYLETMASSIPVVGYDNEAFTGLLSHVDGGLAVPMNDVEKLADEVAGLAHDPERLRTWGTNALEFAEQNTFERAFARRIEQCRALAENHPRREAI